MVPVLAQDVGDKMPLAQPEPTLGSREYFATLGSQLLPVEQFWRAKQPLFERHGYLLRPRLRPGWVPSWDLDPTLEPLDTEDIWVLPGRILLIDATRMTDGRLVSLKRIPTQSEELRIISYFSDEPMRSNEQNHCVPLLDCFCDDEDPTQSYIVMPFLRNVDNPPFNTPGDVIDFTEQILEGLEFMHSHDVAHRDCAMNNIMMDATGLFPKGFHPVLTESLPDCRSLARPKLRVDAFPPIKYCFVDFGISVQLPRPTSNRQVVGVDCVDKEVPELSLTRPYDPFKVDIFLIGNMLRRKVYETYHCVDFLLPLIHDMTQKNPTYRPDVAAARQHWRRIARGVSIFQRMRRLRPRHESWTETIYLDWIHFFRLVLMLARRLAGWSAAWLRVMFEY